MPIDPARNPPHTPPSRIAAQLQDHINRRPDIGENIVALERRPSFQNQQGQLLKSAFDAVGVDRGHRSGMTSVDRAQEGEGFGSAQFAQDDAGGAHAE